MMKEHFNFNGDRNKIFKAKKVVDAVEALQMRRNGSSYDEIAKKLNCSRDRVMKLITDEIYKLEGLAKNEALEVRRMQIERLNFYRSELTARLLNEKDENIVRTLLKIDEHEAKLLGIYAPEKTINANINISLNEQFSHIPTEQLLMIVNSEQLEPEAENDKCENNNDETPKAG